jgi:hypothetical protein
LPAASCGAAEAGNTLGAFAHRSWDIYTVLGLLEFLHRRSFQVLSKFIPYKPFISSKGQAVHFFPGQHGFQVVGWTSAVCISHARYARPDMENLFCQVRRQFGRRG